MAGEPKQVEMFPEIAKEAKEDLITVRREKHKSVSDVVDMRKLGRYIGAKQKEQKELGLAKIRKEIIENK